MQYPVFCGFLCQKTNDILGHRGQVSVPKGLHGVAEAATSFLRDNILTLCPVPRHYYFISFAKNPSMVPFSDEKLMPMAMSLRLSAAYGLA